MLSQVLMHKQIRHPGMPRHLSGSSGIGSSTSVPYNLNSPEGYDTQSIVLALRTLGSFNFDGTFYLTFLSILFLLLFFSRFFLSYPCCM